MDIIVSEMAQGKTLSAAMHEVYTKRNVAIPYHEEWLKCELTSLKMSMRTTQALLRNKMQTIGDIVGYTKEHKITSLKTFGKISAIELFESILDYCWNHMSQTEKERFFIDVVERNSENLRAEIEL
jgi:DNA-directed RNA polymerase alpha subunit